MPPMPVSLQANGDQADHLDRTLGVFVDFFRQHGATGSGIAEHPVRRSDRRLLDIVPLVFWMLPRSAVFRERSDIRVKPLIAGRLTRLGVPATPDLVDVLKGICDQYYRALSGRGRRKFGVADVRATGQYGEISRRQAGRCALCGSLLSDSDVHLDHIIPWFLVGDVPDTSNWQLLCDACNRGKRDYLSARQSPHYWNWIYGATGSQEGDPTESLRYVALALAEGCRVCGHGPELSKLIAVVNSRDGLAVFDNTLVLCTDHAS